MQKRVPVLVDGNTVVSDSQAILTYLALKYNPQWFPTAPEMAAQVVRWLSVAANEISQGLAAARLFYLLDFKNVNIDVATTKATGILSQWTPTSPIALGWSAIVPRSPMLPVSPRLPWPETAK
ncbi:MAG: glutathione S-transferase family protein [Hormoscilla sp. GM7CHS1pb]|nr:glutathione S-transferase family protein [Hormoscilla sp. GM7CHS1pb]